METMYKMHTLSLIHVWEVKSERFDNFAMIEHEQRHKYTAKTRATNDAKSKNRSRDLKTMQAKTKNIITDFVDLPSEDEKKRKANAGKFTSSTVSS